MNAKLKTIRTKNRKENFGKFNYFSMKQIRRIMAKYIFPSAEHCTIDVNFYWNFFQFSLISHPFANVIVRKVLDLSPAKNGK